MDRTITLFLMTLKGLEVLKALSESFADHIDCVVVARDAAQQDDCCDQIVAHCKELGIPSFDRHERFIVKSPYAFAVSWRWLIDLTATQLIVFHDSLLPRYRGFNPLVSCLINGETRIGVTALIANDEYDRGDIIGQSATEISYPITIRKAIEVVTRNYTELAGLIVEQIARGEPFQRTRQDDSAASYSLWRDEDDYWIDWSQPAECIRRFVDAVGFPYGGAAATAQGQKVRLLQVSEHRDVHIENRMPGKVIFVEDACPVVVCGTGLLRVEKAVVEETGASLLPLRKFRTKFAGRPTPMPPGSQQRVA
jgi:methionyl-tRNA formyltransferase